MSSTNAVTSVASESLIGRVKWFNNKAGYGFITVTDGASSGTDVFTHHSSIQVENQQYKYLVQGEYVQFDLTKTTSGQHEYQSSNVHGINGGKLMCETRQESRQARTAYKSVSQTDEPVPTGEPRTPRNPRAVRGPPSQSRTTTSGTEAPVRAKRPRVQPPSDEDKKAWTLVPNGAAPKRTNVRAPRKPASETK